MKKIFKEMIKLEKPIHIIEYFTPSKVFMVLAVSFLLGVYLGDLISFNKEKNIILLTLIILFFLVACLWQKYYLTKFFAVLAMVLFMGVFYYGIYFSKVVPKNLPYGKSIAFEGVIDDEPDITTKNGKYTIKVTSAEDEAIINQKILVILDRFPEYRYGDKLKIRGELERPQNYNTFKYDKYLSRYNIFSLIKHTTNVEYISAGNGNKIYFYLFDFKNKILLVIDRILPGPESSLLTGLLIGAKQNIPENIMDNFNKVGITHIIAISGYNITIIVLALENILAGLSRKTRFLICVIVLLAFVIITAATSSVVRAAIMGLLFLFAGLIGRKKNLMTALIFVAFTMVLINPFILKYDVGFQLSFMATLGLIILAPVVEKYLIKTPKIFKETLSATLSAQMLTIPLVVYYYGRFSIVAPFANILILPIIPTAMLVGFVTLALGGISLYLGRIIGLVAWLFLKYIIVVAEYIAKIPFASMEIKFSQWYVLPIFYLIIYILYRQNKKKPVNGFLDLY